MVNFSFENEPESEVVANSEAGAESNDDEYSEDGAIKNLWMDFQLKIKT